MSVEPIAASRALVRGLAILKRFDRSGVALLGDWRKTMVLACLSWAFAVIVAHLLSWKTVQIAR